MATKFCRNETRDVLLAGHLKEAHSFVDRLKGLLFRPPLQPDEGLLIEPCNSIHMFGMKYAIDVVFYDAAYRVVGLARDIHPGQMSQMYMSARGCIELPSGTIYGTGTQIGDSLFVGQ